MPFDWTQERPAPEDAERIPDGTGEHEVTIARIIYGNDAGPFKTKAGDPRIMVCLRDDEGREAAAMVTCGGKAVWTLVSLISATDIDGEKLSADGVEPVKFTDATFSNANLIGRRLRIRVKHYVGMSGNLAECVYLRPQPQGEPQPPVDPNAIPF